CSHTYICYLLLVVWARVFHTLFSSSFAVYFFAALIFRFSLGKLRIHSNLLTHSYLRKHLKTRKRSFVVTLLKEESQRKILSMWIRHIIFTFSFIFRLYFYFYFYHYF